ncbi:MAG: hypothetical protein C0P74_011905 [Gammaproteobacteria bacterium]|nr:hypothetical protein [Gammaproteobacteria bacterium]
MSIRFDEPLNYELLEEAAISLGEAGRKLRRALDELRDYDVAVTRGARSADASVRAHLVAVAGEALWGLLVQRELLGFRDQQFIALQYEVPREVWRAMGPVRQPTSKEEGRSE